MKRQKWDEREEAVRNRAWRRTCVVVLAAIWANAIWGPWGSAETWPLLATGLAIAAQAAQGIWGHAYFRDSGDQRAGAIGFAVLTGLCGYAFIQNGVSTGQWWDASNPIRAMSFVLALVVLAVLAVRWWVDRRATSE